MVIVGAGGAGLVASIEARDAGASVTVLEKGSKVGGTTTLSGCNVQGATGGADTADVHYNYWIATGEGLVDPDLVRTLANNSGPNVDWLKSQGLKYTVSPVTGPVPYIDPALTVNCFRPVADQGLAGGALFVKVLLDNAQKKGATFLVSSPVTALFKDATNGVVGVQAQSGGKSITVRAKKAVILTSGGFDFNKDMCRAFSPRQLWALTTGNVVTSPTNTGDGIKMAMAIGADLNGIGGAISTVFPGIGNSDAMPGIWVNNYGQRFVNENGLGTFVMETVFNQEEHVAWAIFDENTRKIGGKSLGWSDDFSQEITSGKVKTGATIAALANAIKVNADQLQATVDKWNKDVAAGADTLFHKTVALKPISTPSFYATQILDTNHGTEGGVKINTNAQAIDTTGKIIPRLYAAGTVAGGVFGLYSMGSSIATEVCYGRIAGKNAGCRATLAIRA